MSGQKFLQVLSVAQIVREKKPVAGETCPLCGGPAEVDLFWSTSKDNPGVKILKKQTCCGGHPRRSSRNHPSEKGLARCPVQVEIVATETETPSAELQEAILVPEEETSLQEPETVALRLVPAQAPPPPVRRDPVGDLDAVLGFLSACTDDALDEIGRLAELTRQYKARRLCLKLRSVGGPHSSFRPAPRVDP